ncbi:AbrB/MazE/SpoVT family DNA-binding domain-containing protein [Phreatobacter oligotrophus]|jgi:antitoxin MazE|uniref:AbrB/MazE/SpoVT family DNA-binding domain-containing protein n=1 Tax=Phreatobacter oligotrophus TaxID=1122261 RepID=UPI002354F1E1|nr:AbrB/MazE/SpoVT family DNA-binding domain-containing protein [Phreatobacter oligotrophus]MBX9989006.1 AbrB/MazE/SpoVT family DNA-binding domain-containing protein [Phreatobacter oligotrophus]
MRVAKWGNSLAVRLPQAVVEALNISEGDEIEMNVVGERAVEIGRTAGREELLARLRQYRGALPRTFRFDRLEAQDRG